MTGRVALLLGCLLLAACPGDTGGAPPPPAGGSTPEGEGAEPRPAPPPFEDWYPTAVSPPKGLDWACPLTPLPRDLAGIPPGDHRYLNHTFSLILEASKAKIVMLNAIYAYVTKHGEKVDLEAKHAAYEREMTRLLPRIRAEEPPAGLAEFRDLLVGAIELQRDFFIRSLRAARDGQTWEEVMAVPQEEQGTKKLLLAYRILERRYGGWPSTTQQSLRSHLKALDLL
jgi:hypothetical protein